MGQHLEIATPHRELPDFTPAKVTCDSYNTNRILMAEHLDRNLPSSSDVRRHEIARTDSQRTIGVTR